MILLTKSLYSDHKVTNNDQIVDYYKSLNKLVMHKMNPVVHFEMPAENRIRMSEFYANAFGWKTQLLGADMGNYTLVTTGETDENGMLKNNGNINGGFYPKQADAPAQYPNVVIGVEDLQESMNKIKEAGGTLLGEPTEIPGYGVYISFFDTEGNRSSIIQPPAEMIPDS